MRRLIWTAQFAKSAKKFIKKYPELIPIFKEKIAQLEKDPFANSLRTHKLKGKLSDCYSASITHSHRIIFQLEFMIEDELLILLNIGTHDNVY